MGVVFTAFDPDKRPAIYDVPEGSGPEEIAEQHGLSIYDYCETREEAERRIRKDPHGKLESY